MSEQEKEAAEPQVNEEAQEGAKQLSKAQLKKLAAKQEKMAKQAARQKELDAKKSTASASLLGGENYGTLEVNQSKTPSTTLFTCVNELSPEMKDKQVIIRGRVHNVRAKGNLCFIILRDGFNTVQCVVAKGENVPKEMITFTSRISCESIVDVTGVVCIPDQEISTTTQNKIEVSVRRIFVVSASAIPLPLQLDDVTRPEALLKEQKTNVKKIQAQIDALVKDKTKEELEAAPLKEQIEKLNQDLEKEKKYVAVDEKTRLDNRVVEMRSTTSHAVFRLSSAVCRLFREALYPKDFVEIHTPKLIGCASEGGAAIFEVKYFDGKAYLAQSPQLYKQMCVCGDLPRVFEIGPVFRAENSNSHRHLTEFIGLDLEMAFKENYHEVLTLCMETLVSVFDGLETKYANEIETVSKQFTVHKLEYKNWKIFTFEEAVAMLKENGVERDALEDFNTADEIKLGKIIKGKYNTDFYAIDKFPLSVRPFYTMPDPNSKEYSNGYDIFLRGQEIASGAQRVHDVELLKQRASEKGVTYESIKSYVDSFMYGAPPHAGCGLGLERVVMLFLGLKDVRQTCLFPRDPQRLTP